MSNLNKMLVSLGGVFYMTLVGTNSCGQVREFQM